jgi:hypothetical protein
MNLDREASGSGFDMDAERIKEQKKEKRVHWNSV